MQKTTLSKNKEILNVEIWKISKVVKVAKRKYMRAEQLLKICIFYNSQIIINKLRVIDSKKRQALKVQIYQKTKQLIPQRHQILICWVSNHCGIKRNKKRIWP